MGKMSLAAQVSRSLISIIQPVADDPKHLKPGQLCQLLNGTPIGDVLDDRRLRQHRERAGHRIGDGKTIDLVRYAAWLCSQRERPNPADVSGETNEPPVIRFADIYEAKKERERERNAGHSRSGRDVAPIPQVVDPKRKAKAKESLRYFLEAYFSSTRFKLAWSPDHLRAIERMETATRSGGYFALAMPRGSGKSTITEAAVLWAVLYGYRRYVVFVGASKEASEESMASIKSELENNDLLLEDFPETCHPIRALEGITNRAAGQHCAGVKTDIGWKGKRIVLPTIEGSLASGAIITVTSITGRIRGMKYVRKDGVNVRPELVLLDDPQTDASARSEYQCRTRLKTIATSVMGLPAPGTRLSIVVPCTIIRRGDVSSTLLDKEKFPEFHGETCQMVRAFPTNMELWEQYHKVRDEDFRGGGDGSKATQFYLRNRKAMDAGAEVYWPERCEPWQASGVQYAMDLFLQTDPEKIAAFWSEYQNEPLEETQPSTTMLSADAIAAKISGLDARVVPQGCSTLTSFIDVQHKMLFWLVGAWGDHFSGSAIHYGTFPDQPSNYFSVRNAQRTFDDIYPGLPLAAQIRKALEEFHRQLLSQAWLREDGTQMKIERCLIDSADGHATEQVCEVARTSPHSAILLPSRGVAPGPSDKPITEWFTKEGDKRGDHWLISRMQRRANRHFQYDVNYWKTFVHQLLVAERGMPGCLTLYGKSGVNHRLLADHLTAESPEKVTSEKTGRTVEVWKERPGHSENHYLDCLAGAAAAAAERGISLAAKPRKKPKAKKEPRQAVTYFQL